MGSSKTFPNQCYLAKHFASTKNLPFLLQEAHVYSHFTIILLMEDAEMKWYKQFATKRLEKGW